MSAVIHIMTQTVKMGFGPYRAAKTKVRFGPGSGLWFRLGQVRAWKLGQFPTLVCTHRHMPNLTTVLYTCVEYRLRGSDAKRREKNNHLHSRKVYKQVHRNW